MGHHGCRYNGQIQPTMLTLRNYRSKLTVSVAAGQPVKLTADASSAKIASARSVVGGDVSYDGWQHASSIASWCKHA